jgi:gamma-glutamyltranspeptidase/glutathione hydrolase
MGPPSSGGTTLAGILAMIEPHDVRGLGFHSAAHIHLFAEASRRAFADRNAVLGDPDVSPAPVAGLLDRAYLRRRAGEIDLRRATKSESIRPYAPPRNEGTNTTHISIVDSAGGAVSLTTTINDLYGNLVVVQGAGFLLNNEMDDFTTRPGQPNLYGLVQGEANAVGPGKRMLSSMTPAIVLRGDRVRMVVGSPGGPRIITSVAQVISNVIDFGMSPAEAVAAPRVHHQHQPDRIRVEERGLDRPVLDELRRMGHATETTDVWSDVQLIEIREDGRRVAASDPRRGGAPAAVRVQEPR